MTYEEMVLQAITYISQAIIDYVKQHETIQIGQGKAYVITEREINGLLENCNLQNIQRTLFKERSKN